MNNNMLTANVNEKVNLVKNIANKTRGPYTPEKYGSVIIPMAIIRRFDCVLADKNEQILRLLELFSKNKQIKDIEIEKAVLQQFGVPFYNRKCITLEQLIGDSDNIDANFLEFIQSYSPSVQEILKDLKFREEVEFMIKKGILFEVIKAFSEVDFHPETTSPMAMGYIFEEIIRTYKANAEAGDHYTPREVIELCAELMMSDNVDDLKKEGKIIRVYDGCCGTGGMLTTLKRKLEDIIINYSENKVKLHGQDVNPEAYAVCCAEMLMLGEDVRNIREGNTLTDDKFPGEKFDLLITNPPFGVEWKTEKSRVQEELKKSNNRFVAGTPRVSDGQLLFLQNLLAKAEDDARIAIILNGSPLFSGDAGSGESEIRRYVLENNLLEAIVALPDQMFYNTGIFTYIWILSKKPNLRRKNKIQLINAVDLYVPQKPKSLGNKRKFIDDENREKIVKLYKDFDKADSGYSKIFNSEDFGYTKVTIERPLYDGNGEKVIKKGKAEVDSSKRDTEQIPLKKSIDEYIKEEVIPYIPDAFADRSKDKIGYEIPFTRYFYKYIPPKKSEDLMKEIIENELSVDGVLKAVFENA